MRSSRWGSNGFTLIPRTSACGQPGCGSLRALPNERSSVIPFWRANMLNVCTGEEFFLFTAKMRLGDLALGAVTE
jgi:hypothetical protein